MRDHVAASASRSGPEERDEGRASKRRRRPAKRGVDRATTMASSRGPSPRPSLERDPSRSDHERTAVSHAGQGCPSTAPFRRRRSCHAARRRHAPRRRSRLRRGAQGLERYHRSTSRADRTLSLGARRPGRRALRRFVQDAAERSRRRPPHRGQRRCRGRFDARPLANADGRGRRREPHRPRGSPARFSATSIAKRRRTVSRRRSASIRPRAWRDSRSAAASAG